MLSKCNWFFCPSEAGCFPVQKSPTTALPFWRLLGILSLISATCCSCCFILLKAVWTSHSMCSNRDYCASLKISCNCCKKCDLVLLKLCSTVLLPLIGCAVLHRLLGSSATFQWTDCHQLGMVAQVLCPGSGTQMLQCYNLCSPSWGLCP